MGLRINNNIQSINAQRNLNNTTDRLQVSLERLSSGLRITRASQDPAGLAISEKFRSQIRSLAQAERNALDGISLLQVAEAALNETSGLITRIRELAIQSANGTLGTAERTTLNNEVQTLIQEVSRIANVTEFNGANVLNATGTTVVFQVGSQNTTNDRISVSSVNATATGLSITGVAVNTVTNAQNALATLDTALSTLNSLRARFGTAQNRLESTIRSLRVSIENTTAAESRIRDVDVASETAELTRNQVLQQAGVAVLAQANVSTSAALTLLQ